MPRGKALEIFTGEPLERRQLPEGTIYVHGGDFYKPVCGEKVSRPFETDLTQFRMKLQKSKQQLAEEGHKRLHAYQLTVSRKNKDLYITDVMELAALGTRLENIEWRTLT